AHRAPSARSALRRWVIASSLIVVGLGGTLLTACKRSTPEHEPGVAVVVPTTRATWIRNFNPFFESQARWPATAGIYEPLVIFNRATGEFVPWLATAWRWTNENRTMILDVRRGVEWSDGRPFTPRDVIFTFELMRKFPALDQMAAWKHIESVTAEG